MREIKFRAWDNAEKKWLLGYEYPNLGGFSMFGETMLFNEWSSIINRFILQQKDRKPKDLILMQYTGLKDKNGKEIYEGDIVKASYEIMVHHESDTWGSGEFKNHKGIVRFTNGSFWIEDQCLIGGMDTVEIIGNIYENPELLNPLNKH